MREIALLVALGAVAGLAGCGGTVDMTCDEVQLYQRAEQRPRLAVPEGLDSLDPMREMPLPEASPRPERPEGSPCLDMPPTVTIGNQ